MKNVFLCSTELTCNSNLIDTSRIERYLLLNGWNVVRTFDDCDIVILNTCSFVSSSLNRSQSQLQLLSKKKPVAVYVVGCAVKNKTINAIVKIAFFCAVMMS